MSVDIKKEMILALKKRKENEFNLEEKDLIIDGIDLGKIRGMIGYRGIDIAKDVPIKKEIVNDITCYVYQTIENPKYTLFYLHGGGFYGGSALVSEYICKYMAKFGEIRVVNIEYTLAPKSKFPDTPNEIYNIVKYYNSIYWDNKFGIAGDSAGAHLAMNVSQIDSENLRLITFLAMYYPVISLNETKDWSIKKYNLDSKCRIGKMQINFLKSVMKNVNKFYVPKDIDEKNSMYNLNLITEKEFSKLPDIILAKAEFDYFNLEINEFISKHNLKVYEYKGLSHGFMELLGYIEEVEELLKITIDNLKK